MDRSLLHDACPISEFKFIHSTREKSFPYLLKADGFRKADKKLLKIFQKHQEPQRGTKLTGPESS
jgi:hypothetical protein